jgi:hypothetical protein
VFLWTLGAEGAAIDASFRSAIKIAKEQESIPLVKHAEATYAEYSARKAVGQEDVESDYLFGNWNQKSKRRLCWAR